MVLGKKHGTSYLPCTTYLSDQNPLPQCKAHFTSWVLPPPIRKSLILLPKFSFVIICFSIKTLHIAMTLSHLAWLIQQFSFSIRPFKIIWILIIQICIKVWYLITDKRSKYFHQFHHLISWSCTILNHNTVKFSYVQITRHRIFTARNGIKISVLYFIIFYPAI